jgi:hypothetical protein
MPDTVKMLAMLAGAGSVGEKFFATATAALVDEFGCRIAGVACLSDGGKFLRILAPAGDGVVKDLLRLDLNYVPARALYDKSASSPMHIIGDFADKFPTYQKI